MDVIHTVAKFVDYNRGAVIGIVLAVVASVTLFGCQPTTGSLLEPDRQVDAGELEREVIIRTYDLADDAVAIQVALDNHNIEVEQFNELVEVANADLQRQYEQREQIVATLGGIATAAVEGAINPASIVGSVITLLTGLGAVGFGYDSVRKARVIKALKTNGAEQPAIQGQGT